MWQSGLMREVANLICSLLDNTGSNPVISVNYIYYKIKYIERKIYDKNSNNEM